MQRAFWQLHIAVLLAGITGILGKLITLNEGLLVWWRLLISSVTMWVLFHFTGKLQKISRKEVLQIFGIGAIAAMHWVCFFGSIKYSNVSVGLVCFSAVGFFTALIEPVISRKKWVLVELLLGLLVILGIYIIFRFDTRYKTGIILGLFSALLGALFPIYNRQLLQKINSETLITYELSGGWFALCILLPIYFQVSPVDKWLPSTSDFGWLLVLSWICSVWAFQLSANALRKISAFTVNLTYNLEPVYGIVLAFLVYKENKHLTWSFYTGLSLIVLAVALQTLRVMKRKPVQPNHSVTETTV